MDIPENIDFDLLLHTHLMEHMYSPREFMMEIDSVMAEGKKMVFSVPDLKKLLEECATSVLNFEHTIFLTEDYIEYLLNDFHYEILDKQYFENHSVIYAVYKRKSLIKKDFDFSLLYRQNEQMFQKYIQFHLEQMKLLNDFMNTFPREQEIFLWGGHITTQFYLAFGMCGKRITCILDNDKFKWGKRVCGTNWIICSPAILRNCCNPVVILPSSPYSGEIREQIKEEFNAVARIYEIGAEQKKQHDTSVET